MATVLRYRGNIHSVETCLAGIRRNIRVPKTCGSMGGLEQRRGLTLEALDEMKRDRERVLILGSGWGGFGLSRMLSLKHYQPVVVTPRTYFVFTPLLASTAVGTLEFRTTMESSRSRHGVEVLRGWADSIDFVNKTVTVEGAIDKRPINREPEGEEKESSVVGGGEGTKFKVKFDKIVIGVGAYSQTFGVPGVKEHAFFLKDVADARKIRKRILECFEEAALPTASEERKKQLLHFAVIGGGPTGVEFSAELHDLVSDDLSRMYPSLASYARITIYDIAPRILSMFDSDLKQYAEKQFHRQGIDIRTSQHVVSIEDGYINTKEDGRIPVGGVIWSTGLAANPFISHGLKGEYCLSEVEQRRDEGGEESCSWSIEKDKKAGRVVVDDHLRVQVKHKATEETRQLEDVFALGDCAWVRGQDLPATAQVADRQSKWLGKTLNKAAIEKRKRNNKQGLVDIGKEGLLVRVGNEPAFKYKSLGVMAYLGSWKAITQSEKGDVKGRLAWLMWRTAYFTKSLSLRNRILIPAYWFINWILGRDINRF